MNKQVYQVKNLQSTASYSDAENSEKQVRRIMLHALSGRGEGVYGGEVRPIEKAYIETQYSARLERAMSITRWAAYLGGAKRQLAGDAADEGTAGKIADFRLSAQKHHAPKNVERSPLPTFWKSGAM